MAVTVSILKANTPAGRGNLAGFEFRCDRCGMVWGTTLTSGHDREMWSHRDYCDRKHPQIS